MVCCFNFDYTIVLLYKIEGIKEFITIVGLNFYHIGLSPGTEYPIKASKV